MLNNIFFLKLIHSLNSIEIRYLMQRIAQKKKLLNLFNIFLLARTNNNSHLKKLAEYKASNSNYSRLRKQLYHSIIISLHQSTEKKIFVNIIRKNINEASVLFNKAFYNHALQVLAKTKKLINKTQHPLLLLEINKLEIAILAKIGHSKANNKKNITLVLEAQNKSKTLLDSYTLRLIYYQISFNLDTFGNTLKKSELETLIKHPLLKDEKKIIDLDALGFFYSIYAHYYFIKRKRKTEAKYRIKLFKHIRSYPSSKTSKEHFKRIAIMGNLINSLNHIQDNDRILYYISELKNYGKNYLAPTDYLNKTFIFEVCTQQTLVYFSHTLQLKEGIKFINDTKHKFKDYPNTAYKINRIASYFEAAYINLLNEDAASALYWVEQILKDNNIDSRLDIYGITRILQVLLYFELGNKRLVHHLTGSTNYFMKKHKLLQPVEAIILKFFRKLSNTLVQKEKELFIELKTVLLQKQKTALHHLVVDYFDFSSWIESKIRNKPFVEILKQKRENGK